MRGSCAVSAALEDRDELLRSTGRAGGERGSREERRREAEADEGEGAVFQKDSAGLHHGLHRSPERLALLKMKHSLLGACPRHVNTLLVGGHAVEKRPEFACRSARSVATRSPCGIIQTGS